MSLVSFPTSWKWLPVTILSPCCQGNTLRDFILSLLSLFICFGGFSPDLIEVEGQMTPPHLQLPRRFSAFCFQRPLSGVSRGHGVSRVS